MQLAILTADKIAVNVHFHFSKTILNLGYSTSLKGVQLYTWKTHVRLLQEYTTIHRIMKQGVPQCNLILCQYKTVVEFGLSTIRIFDI